MVKREASPELDGRPFPKHRRLEPRYLEYSPASSGNPPKPPLFQLPTSLCTFSYNADRELSFDDSAMRYFVQPPANAKLGYGYERWIRRPDERGRLDGLLKTMARVKGWDDVLEGRGVGVAQGMEIGVVAWRGIITKILTAVNEQRDSFELNVMQVDGTLYLEEHLTDEKLDQKNEMQPPHRLQSYYGYAFESYCTSDTPERLPQSNAQVQGWGGDVDTNVQWCSVIKTKLGETRMIIGGEVDCVRERTTANKKSLVELKTSMVISSKRDEINFERKLLRFYFQSFLLGVPEIVVGFRTPAGELKTMQVFKTVEIPRLVRGKSHAWDPQTCLSWADRFLLFLKEVLAGSSSSDVWRVKFVPKDGVTVSRLDSEGVVDVESGDVSRVGLLPKWYWDMAIMEEERRRVAKNGKVSNTATFKEEVRVVPPSTEPPVQEPPQSPAAKHVPPGWQI